MFCLSGCERNRVSLAKQHSILLADCGLTCQATSVTTMKFGKLPLMLQQYQFYSVSRIRQEPYQWPALLGGKLPAQTTGYLFELSPQGALADLTIRKLDLRGGARREHPYRRCTGLCEEPSGMLADAWRSNSPSWYMHA